MTNKLTSIQAGLEWLKVAQDANTAGGGFSVRYDASTSAWSGTDYIETTGYIINTLFDIYSITGEANLRTRAISAADWEVTRQAADGSWGGYEFDTGMVIWGMCRAYDETGTASYKAAIIKAADWLLSVQAADGTWPGDFENVAHSYHSLVSYALLRAWQVTGDIDYRAAAILNLDWVLTQQNAVGWYSTGGGGNAGPLTHLLSYTSQGLACAGILLGNTDYIAAAQRTADAFLNLIAADGGLTGGYYRSDWTVSVADECLTGSAQTAIVWLILHNYQPNAAYLLAAQNMNTHLQTLQQVSANTGINGGLYGSDPSTGAYETNHLPNWGVKFFIDALYLEYTLPVNPWHGTHTRIIDLKNAKHLRPHWR